MILPVWRQLGSGTGNPWWSIRPDFVDSQSTRWVHPYRTGLETKSNFVAPFIWTTE